MNIRELRKTDWDHVSALFGPRGACGGCWCMSWRVATHGEAWKAVVGEPNRAAFRALVEDGKAHGILAFDGDNPVGWCAFGRRSDFPRTESMKAYRREDTEGVWSINCFYILKGYRSRGLSRQLAEAAVEAIRKHRGRIIEAYPTPLTKAGKQLPATFAFTGPEILFQRLGFQQVQRASWSRPLYRLVLGP